MNTISLFNIQTSNQVLIAALDVENLKLTYLNPIIEEELKVQGIAIPPILRFGDEFKGLEKIKLGDKQINDQTFARAFVKVYWTYQLHHDIYVWKTDQGMIVKNPAKYFPSNIQPKFSMKKT